jgi:hypothetical protein
MSNVINKIGISEDAYKRASEALQCPLEAIKAFAKVESKGTGFLPSGEPIILFERHIFHRLLSREGLSCSDTKICSSSPGGYMGGIREHHRLAKAVAIHREAALQSASWGMFQAMGFNYNICGYPTLQAFINAAYRSEEDHLDMFVGFIKAHSKLANAIRNQEWAIAARIYNGPAYKRNNYDIKLARAYKEEMEKSNE